jgi:hypothetical protein
MAAAPADISSWLIRTAHRWLSCFDLADHNVSTVLRSSRLGQTAKSLTRDGLNCERSRKRSHERRLTSATEFIKFRRTFFSINDHNLCDLDQGSVTTFLLSCPRGDY